MDTFLIAQGEAMAVGAVPIATAQLGMAHFGHVADPLHGPDAAQATGFAVNRSFAEDDPLLVDALAVRIHQAAALLRERPEEYRRLRANAITTARQFTWERTARLHLEAFTALWQGQRPQPDVTLLLRRGWFDLLSDEAYETHRDAIADAAAQLGEADAFARCHPLTATTARTLFDNAWRRADFARCARIAELGPQLAERLDRRATIAEGRIVYRHPHVSRAELVALTPPGPGRRTVTTRLLERTTTGTFTGELLDDSGEAHLLLTLTSGRSTWDMVRHG